MPLLLALCALLLTPAVVVLAPGADIQAAVHANPAGTAFRLTAGVYANQGVIPKQGNVFVGDSGAVLDGGGTTPRAFWGWDGTRWVDSVTIRSLRITHYAPPAQDAAISVGDVSGTASGTGWVIDSVQVDSNANIGLRIGNRMRITRSRVLANGTLGIGGTGIAPLIEGNEIASNAQGATVAQMDFEAGATKFVRTDSAIIRSNWVHDNGGPGIWLDIENDHALIEANRVENNVREGIVHEIGYAAIIRNNTVTGDGQSDTRKAAWPWGACIGLHASGPGIEVYGNRCTDNAAGIVVIQQARGAYLAQGITVHDNTVDPGLSWPGAHANGAVTDIPGDTLFQRGLSFQHNTIMVRANPAPYAWNNGWRTIAQWRAFGNDTASMVRTDTVVVHDTVRVPAPTQNTNADDSAHVAAVRTRVAGWIRAEARHKPAPRASILLAIGKLTDSLEIAHLARSVPLTVHDTIVVHDTITVHDSSSARPPPVDSTPPPDTLPTPPVDTTAHAPPPPTDSIVELPRSIPSTLTAAPSRRVLVRAGSNLQAALDTARAGDELVLDSSATWTGNFVLRAKTRPPGGWITVRSSCAYAAGTRIDGRVQPLVARLLSPGGGASPALRTEPGASGYRLDCLELSAVATATQITSLLNLGDGSSAQNTLAQVPQDLVVSHLYIHGTPTLALRRGIALHSGSTAIVDSWISECHDPGSDAQAIDAYNGPGPYLIENNELQCSGENVMFGGADPGIPTVIASDITIRRNHIVKPLAWKGVWLVKNLLESKASQRVLVEGNVFENQWAAAQTFAVNIKSVDQGGGCPWCQTTDWTVRFNVFRNVVAGFNIAAHPETFTTGGTTARVAITDNLFDGLGSVNGTTDGHVFQLLGSSAWPLADITITRNAVRHNASVTTSTFLTLDVGGGLPMAGGLTVRDNITTAGSALVIKGNTGYGTTGLQGFAPGYVYGANAIIAAPSGLTKSTYPASTLWPALLTDAWPNWATGDFTPAAAFAALGPDRAKIAALTAGVVLP